MNCLSTSSHQRRHCLIDRLPQPARELLRLWQTLAELEWQALQRCLEILAADDRESRRRMTE